MKHALRIAKRPVVSDHLRPLFKVFLAGFELRQNSASNPVDKVRQRFVHTYLSSHHDSQAEHQAIEAFVEMTAKLNDNTFKPLFRRLYDWSFAGTGLVSRQITFCYVFVELLDYFKVNPRYQPTISLAHPYP
jgi:U3 small nucleolar RNA-associated protein 10